MHAYCSAFASDFEYLADLQVEFIAQLKWTVTYSVTYSRSSADCLGGGRATSESIGVIVPSLGSVLALGIMSATSGRAERVAMVLAGWHSWATVVALDH